MDLYQTNKKKSLVIWGNAHGRIYKAKGQKQ